MGQDSNNNDEIDLRVIFSIIKEFIASVIRFIFNTFLIIKKRWSLILIFTIFGMAVGYCIFLYAKPIYSSSLTLSSSALRNDFCADLVNELQEIVKDKTPQLLADRLKISEYAARQIDEIEFRNYDEQLQEKYKDKDTIVLGLPFKINLTTYDNTIFDSIQTGIVQYLENNEYALKRKAIRKEEIVSTRSKLQNEIHDLDSVKNIVTNNMLPRGATSGFVFGQPIDPVNIYREGIKLFQDDQALSSELVLIDNIQIINDFSPRNKPDFPKRLKTTACGGLIGLLLGVLLALILERKQFSL